MHGQQTAVGVKGCGKKGLGSRRSWTLYTSCQCARQWGQHKQSALSELRATSVLRLQDTVREKLAGRRAMERILAYDVHVCRWHGTDQHLKAAADNQLCVTVYSCEGRMDDEWQLPAHVNRHDTSRRRAVLRHPMQIESQLPASKVPKAQHHIVQSCNRQV